MIKIALTMFKLLFRAVNTTGVSFFSFLHPLL